MKVTRLQVQNVGMIEDADITIDKPEIVFFGEIKQGKSTLLNAVRWVCGGAFPADIIRHGQDEAAVQMEGTDGDGKPWVIRREWYRAKDGSATTRPVSYTRNGVPVKKPVDAIKTHLNPYLLDQDFLRKMSALERGRYMVELFGVDTSAEDAAIAEAERQASQLRIKIKMYGAIDLTPVTRVDVSALQSKRAEVVAETEAKRAAAQAAIDEAEHAYTVARAKVDTDNAAIRKANGEVERIRNGCDDLDAKIADLTKQIADATAKRNQGREWLKTHTRKDEEPYPQAPDVSAHLAAMAAQPDTAEIDRAISEAGAANVRADNYEKAKAKAAEKAKDNKALLEQEKIARDGRAARTALLASVGSSTGIAGLTFTDGGGFEFDGTDSSMLSDSQIMRLSDCLSAKYPEGFGLSMIDRGESLGKSVLTLWEDATAREATVLVTVVGDAPATVPEQVGAYVVEAGKVTRK